MKLLVMALSTNQIYLIIGGSIAALIILILVIYLLIKTKGKKKQAGFEFGEQVLESLGGAENITSLKLSQRRIIAEVSDTEKLIPKKMRELKLGAIITRNQVKILVKDNPREVYKYIQQNRKGVK
ncbi:MAG: hypothetical protein GX232_00170 [Acholeplasmataceae bacterium]|nr:hypothetical protein [Acholeplasmataceae bacterium]